MSCCYASVSAKSLDKGMPMFLDLKGGKPGKSRQFQDGDVRAERAGWRRIFSKKESQLKIIIRPWKTLLKDKQVYL